MSNLILTPQYIEMTEEIRPSKPGSKAPDKQKAMLYAAELKIPVQFWVALWGHREPFVPEKYTLQLKARINRFYDLELLLTDSLVLPTKTSFKSMSG